MTALSSPAATATTAEIASQPRIWRRVVDERAATTAVLPGPGVPVLFAGCGTSYYIGDCYAWRRTGSGAGRTRAVIASEVPWVEDDETLVVLSRSGTTSDVIRLVERLRDSRRVIGVIGAAGTPLVELCHDVVLLDYADERSVVQTRFATSALTLLRAALGEDLDRVVADAETALGAQVPEIPRHLVFLGHGWTVGLAQEAALKCREAAGAWVEAYPIMEYQHGPLAVAGPGSLVWSFAPVPVTVRSAVEATGATVVESALDPQAYLVIAQRLAVAMAAAVGRDPDRPPHLSRSVQQD